MERLRELTDRVREVHKEEIWLPSDFLYGTMLPQILTVAAVLTVIYLSCFWLVDNVFQIKTQTALQRIILCYQMTNIMFNIAVGACGLYYEYWVLPTLPIENNDVDLILGYHEELHGVSVLQLGYQLWAIPVGVFFVREEATMIMHHLAVVVSTSMTGFLSIGFRYYSPFFYGIMEISSIPLSVMNTFRDKPEWQEKYPQANAVSRISFAFCYLFIRVFLCVYRWPRFLFLNFLVMYTREWSLYKLYMILQWSLAAFLAVLQLYWATLILKGIIKMLFPPKDSSPVDKKDK